MMSKDYIESQLHTIADEIMDLEYALSEKRRQRDAMITAGRFAGLSLRAIAEACMVSHQTIANIIERTSSAAGAGATTAPGADRLA